MSLEQNSEHHNREVVDKFVDPQVDYEINTFDYVIRPSAGPYSGPIVLTLPRVSEAKGRFYAVLCRDADGTNTVTIQDRDDSECWANDIVMNNKCDRCLFYSDGEAWFPAFTGGFPQATTTYPPGVTTLAPTTLAPTTAAA